MGHQHQQEAQWWMSYKLWLTIGDTVVELHYLVTIGLIETHTK